MASFNITDKWLEDPRRLEIIEKIGDIMTDGTALKLWRLSFTYFKRGQPLVPAHLFDRIPNSNLFLEHGLAERRGDGVYIKGSVDEFQWYADGQEAIKRQRSDAGKASAAARAAKYGSAVPQNASNSNEAERPPNENRTEPNETEHSFSVSHSVSGNPGSKSSRPPDGDRRVDPIYKSAKDLREGLGSKKIAEWFAIYPDSKFIEEELKVVYQYYTDKPKRMPGDRDSWITAVAYHLKHTWEQRKNLQARDVLLSHMGMPT